jgi:hypothetical protein
MASRPRYDTSSPLAFMLDLMRDESQPDALRLKAAMGAAPFQHQFAGVQLPMVHDDADDDADDAILASMTGAEPKH